MWGRRDVGSAANCKRWPDGPCRFVNHRTKTRSPPSSPSPSYPSRTTPYTHTYMRTLWAQTVPKNNAIKAPAAVIFPAHIASSPLPRTVLSPGYVYSSSGPGHGEMAGCGPVNIILSGQPTVFLIFFFFTIHTRMYNISLR